MAPHPKIGRRDRWFYLYWDGPAEFCTVGRPPDPGEEPDNWCRVTWGTDGLDLVSTVFAPIGDYPPWSLDDVLKITGSGDFV